MNPNEKVNILLVDDQPDKLLSYEAILSDLGENLIKTNSAREALEQLLKVDIAVVLVDVCMPELDGFELAEMIRNHPRFQKTAIILVSAVLLTDLDRLKGYDRGAMDYVPVPVVPEILRAKVTIFADLYRKTRQLELLNQELEQRVVNRTAELEASTEKMRESEQRLSLALESADAASWNWDLLTNRMDWTTRYRAMYGFTEEDIPVYETWLARIHPEDRQRLIRRLQHMQQTVQDDSWKEEFRILHPTLGLRWLVSLGSAVRDGFGKVIRMSGINLDITDRKWAEEDRARLLESERAARAEAECAGRVKDEFLAVLSHELRTPLNSILGWAQLLKRKKRDQETVSKALDMIESSARTQTKLIGDLIDMSRITTGKMRLDFQDVNLLHLTRNVLESFIPNAENAGIKLEQSLGQIKNSITGDPSRLEQIVTNILSNAIKFTPRGGKIRIDLIEYEAWVELVISDTGEGIPVEFLPFVFDRFRQADSSYTRTHGGLGLGLAVVKRLVELHGGAVRVESKGKGKGATFIVRFPLSQYLGEKTKGPWIPLGERDLVKVRALIVDDDPGAAEIVTRLLTEHGAQTETVHSAEAALEKFESFRPNLLISDIGMPRMNGYELIGRVRKRGRAQDTIPALALTAYAQPEDRLRAIQAGYNLHITKPIDPREFLAGVVTLTNSRIVEAQANEVAS